MGHSLPEIEKDALRLSAEDRARLALRLISSLEESVDSPEEIERLWIAEAERRFQELRDGLVQGYPPERSSMSCGRKRGERGNLPPGSSGGGAAHGRLLHASMHAPVRRSDVQYST